MTNQRALFALPFLVGLLHHPGGAAAQPPPPPPTGFVEATGAYGFQLGSTQYLPDGSPQQYEHPMFHGYAIGATAGYFLAPQLALIASWEYAASTSREGELDGVLSRVQAEIDYHTAVIGLRLYQPAGIGLLRAELGLGLLFPHQTRLEMEYGPALAAAGISGTGVREDEYGLGFGGHAVLGYEVPIHGPLYAAASLKLKVFQTDDDGETTRLRNLVTDFGGEPPVAIDADLEHGDGGAEPSTRSVQEARLQLALGVRF